MKSPRGTQFRIWATSILRDHLVRSYTHNQQRLVEKREEVRQLIALLTTTLEGRALLADEGRAVLAIVNRYAKTWRLLLQYDEDRLPTPEQRHLATADIPHRRGDEPLLTSRSVWTVKDSSKTTFLSNDSGEP